MSSPPDSPQASTVAVLGASASPERFSHQAVKRLTAAGHRVIPVNPRLSEVSGIPCIPSLSECGEEVDTVTVYLSPANSTPLAPDLLGLRPRRVIFNPGAENLELSQALEEHGILCVQQCTLVMLDAGTF